MRSEAGAQTDEVTSRLVILVLAGAALAGCGGSGKTTAPPAATTSPAPPTTTSPTYATPSPGPLQAEANSAAAGDIPDNQVFLLFHNPAARSWYETTPEAIRTTALRNATLQGAYLMLAARAVGLDCGPMSGFKNEVVDAAFFPDGRFKSNFLCCLGHGDPLTLPKQDYRFGFDEVCTIV